MSSLAFTNIRGYLCSSSTVTNYVSKSNIKIGWPKELDSFPCVLITQVGGVDTGYLGYKTSPVGSRFLVEENTYQVDIFSMTSRKETYDISDSIRKTLMASGSCKKISDVDSYDDEKNVYRKMITYTYKMFTDD